MLSLKLAFNDEVKCFVLCWALQRSFNVTDSLMRMVKIQTRNTFLTKGRPAELETTIVHNSLISSFFVVMIMATLHNDQWENLGHIFT